MGMAVKVKMLMAARGLTLSALGERMGNFCAARI